MQSLIQLISSRDSQRGQGLAEYALILALIAVLAIAAVTFLGGAINGFCRPSESQSDSRNW